MSTVHVTIKAPHKKLDLTVPADLAIGRLMPSLLELADLGVGDGSAEDWAIAPPGADPLPAQRTLGDCGVTDGAVLTLHLAVEPRTEPPSRALAEPREEPPPPPPVGPAEPAGGATKPLGLSEPVHDAPEPLGPSGPAADPAPPQEREEGGAGTLDPGPGLPQQRSERALPQRLGVARRLVTATRASLALEEEEPPGPRRPDRAAALRPASMTAAPTTTPLDQWRGSWRRTDYRRMLDERIIAPRLRRCVAIGVVSPKGGVGKTTLAALLGSLLSYTRQDRVVAIDAEPDYGSLGSAVTPDHELFVDDVLDLMDAGNPTLAELDASLGRGPDGLRVVPAPASGERLARLDAPAYARAMGHLKQRAQVVLLDCGNELQEPSTQAAIQAADQLLLVTDAEPSTATLVAQAAKLMRKSDAPLLLVVNKLRRRSAGVDIEALGSLVPDAAGLVAVEFDLASAAGVAGGTFTWREPAGRCAVSLRELACVIVSQWPALGLASPSRRAVGGS